MSDSVRILLDRDDLVRLPLIGQRLLEDSKKLPQARPGGDDVFISPVFAPKLPDRNYFIFQEVMCCCVGTVYIIFTTNYATYFSNCKIGSDAFILRIAV